MIVSCFLKDRLIDKVIDTKTSLNDLRAPYYLVYF